MNLHALLVTLLVVSGHQFGVQAKVRMELGHNIRPLLQKTENGNGTILKNLDIIFDFKCVASYPVQWVYNFDDEGQNAEIKHRVEWTDRKFRDSINEKQYDYIAWCDFQLASLITQITLRCESVQNYRDALLVHLVPAVNTVHIYTQEPNLIERIPVSRGTPCDLKLTFMYFKDSGYYARCTKGDQVGITVNQPCLWSGAYCSNTFRNLKASANTCTEVIPGVNNEVPEETWTRLGTQNWLPGVVICSIGEERGAQEYFFTPTVVGVTEIRKIHLSWAEIQPNEMIWMMISNLSSIYYVGQNVDITCVLPKHGFSFDPVLIMKVNNTVLDEERHFVEDFDRHIWFKRKIVTLKKIGAFDVSCLGPVWNSTEWANKSFKFLVRDDPFPPYFEKNVENVTLVAGVEGQEIICEAKGGPPPEVEWILVPSNNVKAKGNSLMFLIVGEYIQGEYTCKATNFLGQATKTITVRVSKLKVEVDITNTKAIVAASSVGIVILVLLFGMAYYYLKFKTLNTLVTGLTPREILEFREGKKKKDGDTVESSAVFIESVPYNNSYELPRNQFKVDTSQILGSGAFGIVYSGIVTTERGNVEAAFKTLKEDATKSHFKALLTELKILAHLGNHEAIVNLIGACTKNLQKGEVYVAVELCDCSLLDFIKINSFGFQSYVQDNGTVTSAPIVSVLSYQNVQPVKQFSTFNLIQWAKEVANGLDFIATKNIIHGDIAARNILLTTRLEAKISDFGLARQLIDYNYIKSEQCPLPWKWMAIESLNRMEFSTKSDVWAYGVMLWEIFSLGAIPYPGLAWSTEFVSSLEHGLRLSHPTNTPKEIWNLMVDCWRPIPAQRPTFTNLKNALENFQNKFDTSSIMV